MSYFSSGSDHPGILRVGQLRNQQVWRFHFLEVLRRGQSHWSIACKRSFQNPTEADAYEQEVALLWRCGRILPRYRPADLPLSTRVVYVLALALLIIGASVLGVYLKRRHRRKKEEHAAGLATPVVWGPHQHQHFTEGIAGYGAAAATPSRGLGVGRGSRKGKKKMTKSQV